MTFVLFKYENRILTIKTAVFNYYQWRQILKYVFFLGDTLSPADTGVVWFNPDSSTVTYRVEKHKPL